MGLESSQLISSESSTQLLTWQGDYTNDALALLLNHVGIQTDNRGLSLEIAFNEEDTLRALRTVSRLNPEDIAPMLDNVENMTREKWDWALPRSLLMKSFASSHLNIKDAILLARKFSAGENLTL